MNTGPIQASKIRPEAVDWLWRERIPRKMITIVGGRPDQGKGLFCTHLAAEVSRMKVRDESGKLRYGRVLYSAIEDSHSLMTRPRLEAAGAVMKNIDLWRFRLPLHFAELEAHLTQKGRKVDLLVIDPLASHLSSGVSRHSDNIRKVTDPLSELIEATGTAAVVVEHVLKRVPQSGHPISSIGGTGSGIIAASRMAYLFGIDPADTDRRILACVKHNIREKPMEIAFELDTHEVRPVGDVPYLLFDEETTFDPMRMLQVRHERRIGRPPDKRAAACEWLVNYLYSMGKPMLGSKVFEDGLQQGFSNKTLRRACTDTQIVKNPVSGPQCKWMLPDELKELMDAANGVNVETDTDSLGPDHERLTDDELITEDDLKKLLGDD